MDGRVLSHVGPAVILAREATECRQSLTVKILTALEWEPPYASEAENPSLAIQRESKQRFRSGCGGEDTEEQGRAPTVLIMTAPRLGIRSNWSWCLIHG